MKEEAITASHRATMERLAEECPRDPYLYAHRRRYEHELALVEALAGKGHILEIGAYPFHFTAALRLTGHEVTAVDLMPARDARLVQRFGLDVRQCDVEREPLPFDDGAFSVTLLCETFEHLRVDPLLALSEINRVLRPGGRLLLTTPNFYSAQNVLRLLTGRGFNDAVEEYDKLRAVGHVGHIREYTGREIERFLDVAGFAVRRHERRHYYARRGRRETAKLIAFSLIPSVLQPFHVFVAEKVRAGPGFSPIG
jgi:SAM-dependent methyltransferase